MMSKRILAVLVGLSTLAGGTAALGECPGTALRHATTPVSTALGSFTVDVCVVQTESTEGHTYTLTVTNVDLSCPITSFAIRPLTGGAAKLEPSGQWVGSDEAPHWWIWDGPPGGGIAPGQSKAFVVRVSGVALPESLSGAGWTSAGSPCGSLQFGFGVQLQTKVAVTLPPPDVAGIELVSLPYITGDIRGKLNKAGVTTAGDLFAQANRLDLLLDLEKQAVVAHGEILRSAHEIEMREVLGPTLTDDALSLLRALGVSTVPRVAAASGAENDFYDFVVKGAETLGMSPPSLEVVEEWIARAKATPSLLTDPDVVMAPLIDAVVALWDPQPIPGEVGGEVTGALPDASGMVPKDMLGQIQALGLLSPTSVPAAVLARAALSGADPRATIAPREIFLGPANEPPTEDFLFRAESPGLYCAKVDVAVEAYSSKKEKGVLLTGWSVLRRELVGGMNIHPVTGKPVGEFSFRDVEIASGAVGSKSPFDWSDRLWIYFLIDPASLSSTGSFILRLHLYYPPLVEEECPEFPGCVTTVYKRGKVRAKISVAPAQTVRLGSLDSYVSLPLKGEDVPPFTVVELPPYVAPRKKALVSDAKLAFLMSRKRDFLFHATRGKASSELAGHLLPEDQGYGGMRRGLGSWRPEGGLVLILRDGVPVEPDFADLAKGYRAADLLFGVSLQDWYGKHGYWEYGYLGQQPKEPSLTEYEEQKKADTMSYYTWAEELGPELYTLLRPCSGVYSIVVPNYEIERFSTALQPFQWVLESSGFRRRTNFASPLPEHAFGKGSPLGSTELLRTGGALWQSEMQDWITGNEVQVFRGGGLAAEEMLFVEYAGIRVGTQSETDDDANDQGLGEFRRALHLKLASADDEKTGQKTGWEWESPEDHGYGLDLYLPLRWKQQGDLFVSSSLSELAATSPDAVLQIRVGLTERDSPTAWQRWWDREGMFMFTMFRLMLATVSWMYGDFVSTLTAIEAVIALGTITIQTVAQAATFISTAVDLVKGWLEIPGIANRPFQVDKYWDSFGEAIFVLPRASNFGLGDARERVFTSYGVGYMPELVQDSAVVIDALSTRGLALVNVFSEAYQKRQGVSILKPPGTTLLPIRRGLAADASPEAIAKATGHHWSAPAWDLDKVRQERDMLLTWLSGALSKSRWFEQSIKVRRAYSTQGALWLKLDNFGPLFPKDQCVKPETWPTYCPTQAETWCHYSAEDWSGHSSLFENGTGGAFSVGSLTHWDGPGNWKAWQTGWENEFSYTLYHEDIWTWADEGWVTLPYDRGWIQVTGLGSAAKLPEELSKHLALDWLDEPAYRINLRLNTWGSFMNWIEFSGYAVIEYAPMGGPDLIVESIKTLPDQPDFSSGRITIVETFEVTVRNLGTRDSGDFTLRFTGDSLSKDARVASLPPGGAETRRFKVPPLQGTGETFTAIADALGEVEESAEENNTKTVTIRWSYPDLVVWKILRVGLLPKVGDEVEFEVTVANRGEADVRSFVVRLQGSGGQQDTSVASLAKGSMVTLTFRLAISGAEEEFIATVDVLHHVRESDEENNTERVVVIADPCIRSINPTAATVGDEGGSTLVYVTTRTARGPDPSCPWVVANECHEWVTVEPLSGIGDGTVRVTVDRNTTGAPRTCTLIIAEEDFLLTQGSPCTFSISPTSRQFAAAGGSVTVNVTTQPSCSWTASSPCGWVTLSRTSGTGTGAVTVTVRDNTGAARSCTLTVAGQSFQVTQEAACTYSISPTSRQFAPAGGSVTVNVTTQPSCSWTASSPCGWVTLSRTSGTGTGAVTVTVAANSGAARSCTVTIAGQSFQVTQEAACTYSISPTSRQFAPAGGSVTVNVTTQPSCSWTASSPCGWVTLSRTSGTGTGAVTVTVRDNTGAARSCTLTVAGQSFQVTQEAACTYSISPTSRQFAPAGGSVTVNVTTQPSCSWTASSPCAWVTLSRTSGTGTGTVTVTVAANSGAARSCTLTIAGQSFQVTQQPVPPSCTYSINPTSKHFGASGGSVIVHISTGSGCSWTWTNPCGWVSVGKVDETTVQVSVGVNSGSSRSCTLTIAGKSFQVTQDGAPACSYSISPTSYKAAAGGGEVAVRVTTGASCDWRASSPCDWALIRTTSGRGNGTVTVYVQPNTGAARSCTLTIAGKSFQLTQDPAPAKTQLQVLAREAITQAPGYRELTASISVGGTSVKTPSTTSWDRGGVVEIRVPESISVGTNAWYRFDRFEIYVGSETRPRETSKGTYDSRNEIYWIRVNMNEPQMRVILWYSYVVG